jgi:alpha-beta hydrolase superfamily lysophospholipase
MLHISDKDPVVSSPAAINFFDAIASENKLLKIVDGGKHELYNDICRAEVYKAVAEFLKQFIES